MKVFSLIFVVVSFLAASDAHPGGLDANGGHYNRKTGEYHYHRKLVKNDAKPAAEKKAYWISSTEKPIIKDAGITVLVKGMSVIPQVT